MPKFIVDLWLDGYESEKEMQDACETFIHEQLNMTASSVHIEPYNVAVNPPKILHLKPSHLLPIAKDYQNVGITDFPYDIQQHIIAHDIVFFTDENDNVEILKNRWGAQ